MMVALALAIRLGFVLASAAPIGAVLLMAVARVTGADWPPLARIARAMPIVALLAFPALLCTPAPPPAHLALWQAPWFVAARGLVATGALAWAGQRIAGGASAGFAGVTLALYAWGVTPVASDWLLPAAPAHSVSVAGMMLAVEQIAAAGALVLAGGWGAVRVRGDLAKLTIAAALGLAYMAYVDYLIVWFGNLPTRVGFYAERSRWPDALAVEAALVLGLIVPAALLWRGGAASQRGMGISVLAALALFDGWWMGGGVPVLLPALLLPAVLALVTRRMAHG